MKRNNSGFTLVELGLVMVLFAVVSGLAVPLYHDFFHRIALTESLQQMSTLISYARARTVYEGTRYRFNTDPQKGTFWLTVATDPPSPDAFGFLHEPSGKARHLPSGITLDGPAAAVTFFPNGTSTSALVQIKDGAGRTARLEMNPVLGQAITHE